MNFPAAPAGNPSPGRESYMQTNPLRKEDVPMITPTPPMGWNAQRQVIADA